VGWGGGVRRGAKQEKIVIGSWSSFRFQVTVVVPQIEASARNAVTDRWGPYSLSVQASTPPKPHLRLCEHPIAESSVSTCARSLARAPHLNGRKRRRPPPAPGPPARGRRAVAAIRRRCGGAPRPAGAARASGRAERRAGTWRGADGGCVRRRRRRRRGTEGAHGAALQCPHHGLNERLAARLLRFFPFAGEVLHF